MAKTIPLNKGAFATVDDEDYERVDQHPWYLHSRGYASRCPNGEHIYMHHVVAGKPPTGLVTDHIDKNPLNNTKANLRFIPQSPNIQRGDRRNSGRWVGVWFDVGRIRYRAGIRHKRKYKFLGRFLTAEEAAHAYDKAALELYGELAKLNFPVAGNGQVHRDVGNLRTGCSPRV